MDTRLPSLDLTPNEEATPNPDLALPTDTLRDTPITIAGPTLTLTLTHTRTIPFATITMCRVSSQLTVLTLASPTEPTEVVTTETGEATRLIPPSMRGTRPQPPASRRTAHAPLKAALNTSANKKDMNKKLTSMSAPVKSAKNKGNSPNTQCTTDSTVF